MELSNAKVFTEIHTSQTRKFKKQIFMPVRKMNQGLKTILLVRPG